MLDQDTLLELKGKMPHRYSGRVAESYKLLHGQSISRWTIKRFFDGETYNEKIHAAVLDVASAQRKLQSATEAIIHA